MMLLLPDVVTVVVSLPKGKESSYLYGRLLSELLCARKKRVPVYLFFFRSLVYAQLLCFVGNGFEFCLIVVGHQAKRHDHFFAVF